MEIIITLDERVIHDAADRAVRAMFASAAYDNRSGEAGYMMVYKSVGRFLATAELQDMVDQAVRETVARQVGAVVANVVEARLTDLVKARVKAMKADGSLLAGLEGGNDGA